MPPKKAPLDPLQYLLTDMRLIKYIQQSRDIKTYKQQLHKQLFPNFDLTDSDVKDAVAHIQNQLQIKQESFKTVEYDELATIQQVNTYIESIAQVTNQLQRVFKSLSFDKHLMQLNNMQIVPDFLVQKIHKLAQKLTLFEGKAEDLAGNNLVVNAVGKLNVGKLVGVVK